MKPYLGPRSLLRLRGVHPDLFAVVKYAISMQSKLDFTVVCGLRSLSRQSELFAAGLTRTMASRHLTGHAVDLAPMVNGKVVWSSPAFRPLSALILTAAHMLQVTVRWGGDWNGNGKSDESFIDMPHFELPRGIYHPDDMDHHSERARSFLAGKL